MTDIVADQYLALPYPARDPAEEDSRLISGAPSDPLEINHYIFGGALEPSRSLKILDAGGGTGDATVMMAQRFADQGRDVEIVYNDLSPASRAIAEARIQRRGLRTVRFLTADLESLGDEGPFDYINCCGVLHHLADPDAGLTALSRLLAPGGGMGLMVYAPYGRTGVYQMQQLVGLLGAGQPVKDRLTTGKRIYNGLGEHHWIKRNPFVGDHLTGGDAGFYDLLCHERDRPFTVAEVDAWLDRAGLRRTGFIEPIIYQPEHYTGDAVLKAKLSRLAEPERAAAAELLSGAMKRHIFYVVAKDNPVALPTARDETLIPVLKDGLTFSTAKPTDAFKVTVERRQFRIPARPGSTAILRLIDGERSLAEIRAALPSAPSTAVFQKDFDPIHRAFNGANLMLYRRKSL